LWTFAHVNRLITLVLRPAYELALTLRWKIITISAATTVRKLNAFRAIIRPAWIAHFTWTTHNWLRANRLAVRFVYSDLGKEKNQTKKDSHYDF
jgi:hypothetical protein